MARAVFLDRDGVLNRAFVRQGRPMPPQSLAEFEIFPEAGPALRELRDAGFLLIVVTNQPDVARGTQTRETVEAMHARLLDELPLDEIRGCYETDGPDCTCYKPKPGMVLAAAATHGIDLGASYLVGDRWRDVDCARAAGCRAVFVDRGYEEKLRSSPDVVVGGIADAARYILKDAQVSRASHSLEVSP